MQEVYLRVVETSAPPNGTWTSELWSGFPGSAGTTRVPGGGKEFTQAQLEAPTPQGDALDRAFVLDKIRNEDQDHDAFAEIGFRLYELLDVTGTAADWQAMRTQAARAPGPSPGLRTYLEVTGTLAEWPWELLAWKIPGAPGQYDLAFQIPRHPMVRVATPADENVAWNDKTIRILLVSGQEQLDKAENASAELRLIRQTFHKAGLSVIVDLCEAPESLPALQDHVTRFSPHVLHFIGHGDFDAGAREFFLTFNRPTANPPIHWEWPTNEIRRFFADASWKPRLVVLNSCHSSQRELDASPVATALLAAGVPAVIGAQAALQIDYAREFSKTFYGALAQQLPLDQAMTTARKGLSGVARYQGYRKRHWALPVLTIKGPAEQILKFTRSDLAITQCEVARDVYARPGKFVNRSSDRWSILSALCPADPGAPRFRGVILESEMAKIGKDWLVKRCLRDFLDGGFMVRYATLVGKTEGRSSLDVLEDWRGRPGPPSPIRLPIPGPHFDQFDEALKTARADRSARNIEEAFRTFKKGLQSARQGKNVLLVLGRFREKDSISIPSQEFQNQLLAKLLLPIRAVDPDPEVEGLYALLTTRTHTDLPTGQNRDFDEFSLGQLCFPIADEKARVPADGFRFHQIGEFVTEQFNNHFDEFADFADFTTSPAIRVLRDAIRYVVPERRWSPGTLADYEKPIVNALKAAVGK